MTMPAKPVPPDRAAELKALLDGEAHVYIDYANIRNCCSRLGWQIDLRKLKNLLSGTGQVKSARFYFGTIAGDKGSEGFVARARKEGFDVTTKPVKFIDISINVSSITSQSTSILQNFVHEALIRSLKVEVIEYLNKQLADLNAQGRSSLEIMKCNFDVEIATDMRLDHALNRAQTYCLWSGDSDFAHPISQLLSDGRRVVVVSMGMARELSDLRPSGMVYFDLRKLKSLICR
ncbi:MAG TPA: NYN domain-containing protein [Candidatus Acidoferrales bacterium]